MSTRSLSLVSLFPLMLATLLAGMSFWLERASRASADGNDGRVRHDPDYWVDNFVLRRFDTSGELLHTLVGKKMLHYPDDDSTIVRIPRLVYHRLPTTLVTAREAHVDGKGQHVRLFDDVIVIRGGKPGKEDSLMRTTRLDAYPDDDIVITDVPVTITQGMTNVQGNTLFANNKTSFYILEGAVQGIFFRDKKMAAKKDDVAKPPTATGTVVSPPPEIQRKPEIAPASKRQATPKIKQNSQPKTPTVPKPRPPQKAAR